MTTSTLPTRTGATTRTGARGRRLSGVERHGTRVAGLALLAMVVVSVPATWLLDAAQPWAPPAAGVAFLGIAALDVSAGWGLYLVLRRRAHPPAYAALVSRVGYAVLLAASAARLLWPGGGGVEAFRADWDRALLVFGLHLVVAAVALWRSRLVPRVVVAATAAAGAAYLLDAALARFTEVGWRGALVPVMLGEVVLMGWLLLAGRRRDTSGAGPGAGGQRPVSAVSAAGA